MKKNLFVHLSHLWVSNTHIAPNKPTVRWSTLHPVSNGQPAAVAPMGRWGVRLLGALLEGTSAMDMVEDRTSHPLGCTTGSISRQQVALLEALFHIQSNLNQRSNNSYLLVWEISLCHQIEITCIANLKCSDKALYIFYERYTMQKC